MTEQTLDNPPRHFLPVYVITRKMSPQSWMCHHAIDRPRVSRRNLPDLLCHSASSTRPPRSNNTGSPTTACNLTGVATTFRALGADNGDQSDLLATGRWRKGFEERIPVNGQHRTLKNRKQTPFLSTYALIQYISRSSKPRSEAFKGGPGSWRRWRRGPAGHP